MMGKTCSGIFHGVTEGAIFTVLKINDHVTILKLSCDKQFYMTSNYQAASNYHAASTYRLTKKSCQRRRGEGERITESRSNQ